MAKPRVSAAQRAYVAQRAKGCCEYCKSQARFSPDPFSIEHIIPVSKGGTDDMENLALSCQGCNGHKYNHTAAYDPVQGKPVSLYHPRQQAWAKHFAWNNDCSIVLGLTAIGRATVEKLQLNRSGVVNLRRALYVIDRHPP
ncbi:MAG: HNH endonuclease signature motif containing protein [Cyanobacteria bacterium P01_A01_bin.123]